jgi:hypothetical protein
MNRIERLLWEEAHLRDMEKRRSRATTFAKALSIGLAVGVLALLASRPWPPSFPEARVQKSTEKWAATQAAAAPKPAAGARTSGAGGRIIEPERYAPRKDAPEAPF